MKHDWEHLFSKDKAPHARCRVCRMLVRLAANREIGEQLARREPCPGAFIMPPHISEQYQLRVARWAGVGLPRRSPKEVDQIYWAQCSDCDQRTAESVCRACECRVLPHGPAECNLVAMKTETCPLNKWA